MIVGAIALSAYAYSTRRQLSSTSFYTPPIGLLALFLALGVFGASFVMLMQNPMRSPFNERLQQRLWLGWLGRLALRLAMGGASAGASGDMRPTRSAPLGRAVVTAPTPRTVPRAAPAPDATNETLVSARVTALEQRVAALEQQRQ
jgi:hypothetical protein